MYHVNKKMIVMECEKEEGKCKLDPHFSTYDEAQDYADSLMSKEYAFTPNVIYLNNIPSDDVVEYLSLNHSELYVISQLINNDVEPIVIVGQTENDEAFYHCVFQFDDLFQDISGVIASSDAQLDHYMKTNYHLVDEPYAVIRTPKSSQMIGSLVNFDIYDSTARGNMVAFLYSKLEQAKQERDKDKYYSMLYLIKELT